MRQQSFARKLLSISPNLSRTSEQEEPVESRKLIAVAWDVESSSHPTIKQNKQHQLSYFTPQRMTLPVVWSLFPPLKMTVDASQSRLAAFIFQQQSLSRADALIRMRESLPPTLQWSFHVIVIWGGLSNPSCKSACIRFWLEQFNKHSISLHLVCAYRNIMQIVFIFIFFLLMLKTNKGASLSLSCVRLYDYCLAAASWALLFNLLRISTCIILISQVQSLQWFTNWSIACRLTR